MLGRSRRERSEAADDRARGIYERGQVPDGCTTRSRMPTWGWERGSSTRSTRPRAPFRHDGRDYLVTDTVGFIRKLPHQLVDAFKATLEETTNADLILHVVDASAPEDELEAMLRAVDEVLDEIGAGASPRLLVLNKIDLLDEDERRMLGASPPGRGAGVGRDRRGHRGPGGADRGPPSATDLQAVELLVPFEKGRVLSELRKEFPRRPRARGHARRRTSACAGAGGDRRAPSPV